MARSFGELVASYREIYGLTPEEARSRIRNETDVVQRILALPPSEVSWDDLDKLERHCPEGFRSFWEGIKEAARDELRSGITAAKALGPGESDPWDRARFLAVRAELTETYRPRPGVEQMLVDQLAQWQAMLWKWQEILADHTAHWRAVRPTGKERTRVDHTGTPRLTDCEAMERAAGMVERIQRMWARTLKALQDQRRVPGVVVRNAGQVNVGGQQVNVSR
jgi:hypothetical protein